MCMKPECKDKRVKVRPVPNWENYYVTTDGKVYRITEMTPVKNEKGYLRVRLNAGGRRVLQFVHRLVASAFDKRRQLDPEKETVDHRDKETGHNCRGNLEVVTNIVNIHRRWRGFDAKQVDITKPVEGAF